ncbi:hypothetical protein EVAR_60802_1 [Eumeta japonica]|uniref:Uncharacterized protein n=1 Tax=Eumeta variegata TaxID=151549 RepID=A0A4C1YME3_EUMVA|nr:hypothetical protein EVAR_60802_1 [Eumeta japonica]
MRDEEQIKSFVTSNPKYENEKRISSIQILISPRCGTGARNHFDTNQPVSVEKCHKSESIPRPESEQMFGNKPVKVVNVCRRTRHLLIM